MNGRIAFESAKKQSIETARTRLLVGGSLMVAAFVVVGVRLVDLAVFNGTEDLRRAASREIARPATMARADIVDRNGVLLATNLKTASLFADPRRTQQTRRTGWSKFSPI
jgi:cell division protein FtsI (penicillin-binding protein 3)